MKPLSSSTSNTAIAKILATTVLVAVLSVLVSRLFDAPMISAVAGGVFGGIMTLFFDRGSKSKAG
jgi:hypothetical protein